MPTKIKARDLFASATGGADTQQQPKHKKNVPDTSSRGGGDGESGDEKEEFNNLGEAFGKARSNNSLFSGNRSKLKKSFRKDDDSDSSDDLDSESGDDDSADSGKHLKLAIPKKDEKKKKAPKEEEDSENNEEEESKPDGKKEQKKEEKEDGEDSENEHDDALKLEASDIKTKDGRPISSGAAENFNKVKASAAFYKEKFLASEKALKAIKEAENKNSDLEARYAELKKKYDDKYFEETPEFVNQFVAPLKTASDEMSKWMKVHDHEENSEEVKEMAALESQVKKALADGDETSFVRGVDAISDFLPKGASLRFIKASESLWNAFVDHKAAYADKDAARKSVTEKVGGFVDNQIKESVKVLEDTFTNFEQANARAIKLYKENPTFKEFIDYDNTVTAKVATAKSLIETAIRTRKIPRELSDLIFLGATHGLSVKEKEAHMARIDILESEIEKLRSKLDDKDETLDRVRPSSKHKKKSDDSDSKPKSLTDLWAERFQPA